MTNQTQTIISPSAKRVLDLIKRQDEKIAGLENHIRLDGRYIAELEAENERLTAELTECRQAAFDNGRAVGAVVGELGY